MTITPSFFMPEEFDGNFLEEPVSRDELSEAARIAAELLPRGGWTGAQIELLEAVMAWNMDDPFILTEIEDMRDARDREEALRR